MSHVVHNLVQGSAAWHQFRLDHDGASEAAAMLGLSTKVKRTDLLKVKKSGIAKEFSDWVQSNVLDHGHAVEALARPIVERIIGEDLYPVTCSKGKKSASCDGLTMTDETAFEHKQWNEALAASVRAKELPDEYMPQCQQIMMVTDAKRVIFVVSDGTEERMEWMEVLPDPAWQQRIDAGWAQFEQDLIDFVPVVEDVKPTGRAPETLPALLIEISGQVSASNLGEFKAFALGVFANIKRELDTDEDFANAEQTVKWCENVEDRLAGAKQHALAQTASIDELFRAIDEISAEARRVRLDLDKLVKARKESIRGEIVADGVAKLKAHIEALNTRLGKPYMPPTTADFGGAIKGKRSVSSIRDAVNTLLAATKIAANETADRIQVNLTTLRELAKDHAFLFADTSVLVLKANDDLTALVKLRISEHKEAKALEEAATLARIEAAAKDKAQKDAAAANAAALQEIQGIQQQVYIATTGRMGVRKGGTIECIRETLAETEAWTIDNRFGALKGSAQVAKDNAITSIRALLDQAEARAAQSAAAPTPVPIPVPAAPITHEAVVAVMPATVRQAMAPKPSSAPTMSLGEISTRLGFNVTSVFLASLGFEATTVKAAKLYQEDSFSTICEELISHIRQVQCQFEPVFAE